jgi:recombining binding protein (suppressor of hairless)
MKGPSSHGVSSTILHPPTLTLGMSEVGNPSPQEGSIEWTSTSGNTPGDTASTEDMVLAGRCVGKQIHITDVDEKSKKVEALVTIIAPGPGHWMTRHIGTFPSKPIKVISKPSKKRQTSKTVDREARSFCARHFSVFSDTVL